ncbi:BspA family leucine-rich repeat surface protein [Chryseobacterium sp.]|uniref:BspA family leucine-rich repeat surface protein n=1 Tax=Chryseobacterium sp. TaxID=1871047 RepID=UPI002FCBC4B0
MYKKLLPFIIFFITFQITKAQNEFITIWKPNNTSQLPLSNPQFPTSLGENQIWFPGIGDNYLINWEEIGYPQHNGTMPNVTSTASVLIDFGTSLNPNATEATYRVKVSNGNGVFKQIKFSDDTFLTTQYFDSATMKAIGSADKIIEVEQWGNIQWTTMKSAFSQCGLLTVTATDSPDLSNVTDVTLMFYNAFSLQSNTSMENWDTSHIKIFKYMFAYSNNTFLFTDNFNPNIGLWDTSAAEDISYMFMKRKAFNQDLNGWDTSKVTTMAYTFAECNLFNQPLDQWDTSQVKNMAFMFHLIPNFNQSLKSWNTSNVTDMSHMFHFTAEFNQPLDLWDVSKVTDMNTMFSEASKFNQTLKTWNLNSLISANGMIRGTGIDCFNYSTTLYGWAHNLNTPNNINLFSVAPLTYSGDTYTVNARNTLLNSKNWIFTGDTAVECDRLGTHESSLDQHQPSIFPNPVDDVIQFKNLSNMKSYSILDASGRIILRENLSKDFINVQSLAKGNYIIQISTKDKNYNFKFIKK